MKLHFIHCHRDVLMMGLPDGFDIGGLVDERQDHPAEDGTLGVGVAGHHHHANRWFRTGRL